MVGLGALRLRGRLGGRVLLSKAARDRRTPKAVLPDARTALMMPGKAIDLICRDDADTEEKSGGFSNRSLQI